MVFVQAVLGGLFTILGASSIFFIAYKALTIGNDVAEMKEMLREMQRGSREATAGNSFPASLDSFEPPTAPKAVKEFVLPPPISRCLDAERGIRNEPADELPLGFKSSERRH